MFLFNFFGFLFYTAMGFDQIEVYYSVQHVSKPKFCFFSNILQFQGNPWSWTLGSLALITSFVYLTDIMHNWLTVKDRDLLEE